jgi:Htaa
MTRAARVIAMTALAAAIPATSSAATQGTATISPASKAKAAKSLRAERVRLTATAPAKAQARRISLPVTGLAFGASAAADGRRSDARASGAMHARAAGVDFTAAGPAATIRLGGGVRLRAGRRSTSWTGLTITLGGTTGRLAAGSRTLFTIDAAGLKLDRAAGTVKLTGAPIALTRKGAAALEKRLRRDDIAAGSFGRLTLDVRTTSTPAPAPGPAPQQPQPRPEDPAPNPDPYAGLCPIGPGGGPGAPPGPTSPPAPAPNLTNPVAVTSATADWGFRAAFRGYVGSGDGRPPIRALDPATINPDGTFHFTGTEGRYETGTDRASLDAKGTIVFCYPGHFFRITIGNPTIALDGAASRITLDVSTNQRGTYHGTRRVDFATLDLTGIVPERTNEGKTITWRNVPARLTADGATAFGGFYPPGTALDPITVTAHTA